MYVTDHTGATLHALVGVVDATLELTGEACNDQKKHVAPPRSDENQLRLTRELAD